MFPSARLARTSYMSWANTSIGKAGMGASGAGGTGGGGGGGGAGAGTGAGAGADGAEEEAISSSSTSTLGSLGSFGSSLGSLLSLSLLPAPCATPLLSRFLPPSSPDSRLSDIKGNQTGRRFGVGVGEGGGRQLCVHEQFFGPGKRGKHSCVGIGSAISFENGACRSAKKQLWSITVIISRPHVPTTSAHQSNSQTRVLWGEMFNVYSWSDGDFFTKTLGISLGFSKQLGMQSS